MAMLKDAVHSLLETKGADGASNAEIGRALGIYKGHVSHEGTFPERSWVSWNLKRW